MNIKSEKGVVGMDITVALILLLIFLSIIGVLFYNILITGKGMQRQEKAVHLATSIVEKLKAMEYSNVKTTANKVEIDSSQNTYQSTNGAVTINGIVIESGYTTYITVSNYYPSGEENPQDLVKILKVEVEYKILNEIKNVTIETSITKN